MRHNFILTLSAVCGAGLLASACGDDKAVSPDAAPTGATLVFDLGANLEDAAHFFDAPYPSDLRVDANGKPDLAGFPNKRKLDVVSGLVENAAEEKGFPVLPVAHFRFTAPIAARTIDDVIAAAADSPILLVDIDATSPDVGKFIPTIADTPGMDDYIPENLLSVAPRPGFVLRPGTTYAYVVRTSANDAGGKPLAVNDLIARLAKRAPSGAAETRADALFAPLWPLLTAGGVDPATVAAATVFTTANVVQETSNLVTAVAAKYSITVDDLAINPSADDQYPEFCYLLGHVTYPQFQVGAPPFDTDGHFAFGADGLPVKQRDEVAPIVLLIPKTPMPAKGYPILFNIHGSGGYSVSVVRPVGDDGLPGPAIGPAFPITSKGIAIAGSAMPVNPERLPGATETAYLNPANIAAMRDTFRQGVLEQRMFFAAVKSLTVDPARLATCIGPTLPVGATAFKFDPDLVLLTGQSMGGMYANIIAATDKDVKAVVPTGAGGYWTHFIFQTPLFDGAFPSLLQVLIGSGSGLNWLHPVLGIGDAALEAADPIIYMPHVARHPLPGHPVRPIYRPVGIGDSYFSTATYDAVAISFRHKQAGEIIWQSMQDALALVGESGLVAYPVSNEMTSEDGTPYTGVVAQYMGDGTYDPHALYSHDDGVKHQYACFWDSFVKTGVARVPPPTKPWQSVCE